MSPKKETAAYLTLSGITLRYGPRVQILRLGNGGGAGVKKRALFDER